jgi:5-methylcytosine-specific restriction endonuclease McrA
MSTVKELVEELRAIRTREGYAKYDEAQRTLNRERLDAPRKDKRVKFSWSVYKQLYEKQKGVCLWCTLVMPMIKGQIEVDHINPSAPAGQFNDRRNLQVLHAKCNREKSAMSLSDQAKRLGLPVTAILNGGRLAEEEVDA